MREEQLRELLDGVGAGRLSTDDAVQRLKNLPFEDIGYANIDHHRGLRRGQPETIYCEGKTVEQVRGIVERMLAEDVNILATRASAEVHEAILEVEPQARYHADARIVVVNRQPTEPSGGEILVISAGTSDLPVAEEAAVTAEVMGNRVKRVLDVGVAGIHRLLAHRPLIEAASVVVVVAGMEGALPSVVAGLASCPVVAVPTSVGYGASFGGLAAMLTMINSCASGIAVVNIDNGYGAGYFAALVNSQTSRSPNDD